jgi:hypothetical protein
VCPTNVGRAVTQTVTRVLIYMSEAGADTLDRLACSLRRLRPAHGTTSKIAPSGGVQPCCAVCPTAGAHRGTRYVTASSTSRSGACCGILIHIDEQADTSEAEGAQTSDPRAEALRLYMSGLNLEQVASKLHTSVRTVRRLLAGTPKRPRGTRRTDISDERVQELREVHQLTWEQIGDTVGLTTPGAKSRYVAAFARRGDPSRQPNRQRSTRSLTGFDGETPHSDGAQ